MGTDARRRATAVTGRDQTAAGPEERDALPKGTDVRDMSFFALVKLLQQRLPDAPEPGGTDNPAAERIRFGARASFGFPPGEVESFAWDPDTGRGTMRVNFLGIFGPSSPLPPTYTEQVIGTGGEESTLGQFLDLFNHRLTGLLVRIWEHHRHHLRYRSGGNDAISRAISALSGILPADGDKRRAALLPFVGLLRSHNVSASIVASLVGHGTGLPVAIEEFVQRTVVIPPDKRSRLGDSACELGGDLIAGEEVGDLSGKFRVLIGPLERAAFAATLPDQPAFAAIVELIEFSLHDPLAFDVRLQLGRGELPHFTLGEGRLGWDLWLAPEADAAGFADFPGETRHAPM